MINKKVLCKRHILISQIEKDSLLRYILTEYAKEYKDVDSLGYEMILTARCAMVINKLFNK